MSPVLGLKAGQRRVGAARRPDLDGLALEGAVVDVGEHRPAGLKVDARSPVHFHERVAAISLPLVRSITYMKPFLLA